MARLEPVDALRFEAISLKNFTLQSMPRYNERMKISLAAIGAYALAAAAAIFLGRFELHTDDTGVEVGLILLTTFLLGCLHPRQAWQWALLVGSSIPLAHLLFGKAQFPGLAVITSFVLATGLIGSYSGAFLRRAIS
jgi:hypothetical protein